MCVTLFCFFVCVCRTVIWDKNNTSPQGLQDVAAALEKYVALSIHLCVCDVDCLLVSLIKCKNPDES